MLNKPISILVCILLIFCVNLHAIPWRNDDREDDPTVGLPLVRKDERVKLVSTEYGEVSAVRIGEGKWGPYYNLQFITLEPNALFLPVALHADMVFFVHSGSGKLSWADGDKIRRVELKRGDVYRLPPGAIFFVQSNLDNDQQKLRIHAIFTNPIDNLHEVAMEAYSSIPDLVLGFGKKVLQSAFQVSEEMIEELMSGRQEAIVQAPTTQKKEKSLWETDSLFMEVLLGRSSSIFDVNKKKTKTKAFNIFERKPDFKNRYGKSLIVNKKDMSSLKKPDLSIFMVNLTGGSMMGPHWNPMSSEVSIVLQGEGMIHIVGPIRKKASNSTLNTTFRVGEGDVFVVPRFQPMAQMAFSNHSFVFMGFSTTTKKNHPQYLAGKASVLRTLDKDIMAASFAVTNMSKFDWLLDQQEESVILECASCAEEELTIVEEEIRRKKEEARRREEEERKREEEEKRRREEEARRREEEERKREEEERKREEEEKKRREEEEEARKREEEARRKREEEARREEEEAKRQEEERRQREEEEARKEEEEEKRREEEEKKRREEEEEARKREEEARRKREEEARREEEEAKRQEEERRQREEEEARKEEEEEKKRQEEEEEARKREEEARRKREEEARREEEEAKRQEEERRRREEEETRKEEEKEAKRQEEERRRQEEEETRKEEEKEAKRQEDERKRQEEEEKQKRQEKEEARRKEEEEQAKRQEEEEAKRQKEEEVRREEEEAKRQEEERRQREEEEARRQEKESRKKEEAEEKERRGQEEKEKQGRQKKGGGEGRKGEEEYVKMRETEARKKEEEAAKREEEEARKQEEEVKRKEEEIVQEEEWSKGKKSE